jgi:hypothetical protein
MICISHLKDQKEKKCIRRVLFVQLDKEQMVRYPFRAGGGIIFQVMFIATLTVSNNNQMGSHPKFNRF